VEAGEVNHIAYLLAFLEGDNAMMAQMADLLDHQPGYENTAVLMRAQTKIYYGQVRDSRALLQVLADTADRDKKIAGVGYLQANLAVEDALLGFTARALQHAETAAQHGAEGAALAFALAGDPARAAKLSKKIAGAAESDPNLRDIRLPELYAAIEMTRGNSARAIELLEPVKRFEEGWIDSYWAAYIRGLACLAGGQGQDAALEFQKIVDHRGLVQNALYGAVAHIQLARAHALQGDVSKARKDYEDFFALWKDADSDIPIRLQAKAEYARLH
jgi:hypothetical protein